MPGKKKKYNARFPPARIKKIMQTDEEVGKVAQAVPVIISRALELFADNLLNQANKVTLRRGARTLTPSHLKFCIENEGKFDFLRDMVANVPDLQDDDLEMDLEGDVIPMLPASKPRPKPLSTNGRSDSIENMFKEPQSRESTPGSPHNFPSPTPNSSTPTSTSSRGGATPKRRGRPPKNGILGRGFPPMPGDKRKFAEDLSVDIKPDSNKQTSGFGSDIPTNRPFFYQENTELSSESISLPGSPLARGVPSLSPIARGLPSLHRANSHGTNGRDPVFQLSSKRDLTSQKSPSTSGSSPSTSGSSSGSREFNTSRNQNYNHHHHSSWAGKKFAALPRSNSTPTGFVFSVSPLEEGSGVGATTLTAAPSPLGGGGRHTSLESGGASTTPSFTINVSSDITANQAAIISSSSGQHSSYQLPPSTLSNANSKKTNTLSRTDSRSTSSQASNSISKGDNLKCGAKNTLVKLPGRQGHPSVIRSAGRPGGGSNNVSKKHNGHKSSGSRSDVMLYPRDSTGGGFHHSDRGVVVTHPEEEGGERLPMDLSVSGKDGVGLGPSLLQDLSRHNAFNTSGPAGNSISANFSRYKPLDEDYDC